MRGEVEGTGRSSGSRNCNQGLLCEGGEKSIFNKGRNGVIDFKKEIYLNLQYLVQICRE